MINSTRTFRPASAAICLLLLSVLLTVMCGKKNPVSSNNQPTDPQPNPDGVLLPGGANDDALAALFDLPPSPAAENDIDLTGLMLTRLEAVLSPGSTVGQVNSLLQSTGVRVICMANNIPFMTLKTPGLANRASADSLAALLTNNGAFAFAFSSYAVRPDSMVDLDGGAEPLFRISPGGSAANNIEHLTAMKMQPAWNLRDTATSSQPLRVLVPDCYTSTNKHVEIPSQEFITAGQTSTNVGAGTVQGNHGFHVCGIIGAVFDSAGATGVHPDAGKQLRIISMPISGFNFFDKVAGVHFQIASRLPSGRFLLNTSLGYNDPTFSHFDKVHRAFLMLVWRSFVGNKQSQFLHLASAGNNGKTAGDGGTADFGSPWNSGAIFSQPKDMIAGVNLTPKEDSAFDEIVAQTIISFPSAQAQLTNVIIVGGNNASGQAYPESSRNSDVRCVEDLVFSTCSENDPGFPPELAMGCKGQNGWYTGTSFAAPQITGLAAYLWTLSPSLAVPDLRQIILAADLNNQVDAYSAVLALDVALTNSPMRLRLLDIADETDAEFPDGQFTEHDITLFLEKFHEFEQLRGTPPYSADFSRYDLNGDGVTGDSILRGGPFDLDVNNPQSFGTATQQIRDSLHAFDETDLTDYDILCYYGYSDLFTGDLDIRDGLLPCGSTDPDTTIDTTATVDLTGQYIMWITYSHDCVEGGGGVFAGTAQLVQNGNQLTGTFELSTVSGTCTFGNAPMGDISGSVVGLEIAGLALNRQALNDACPAVSMHASGPIIISGDGAFVTGLVSGDAFGCLNGEGQLDQIVNGVLELTLVVSAE